MQPDEARRRRSRPECYRIPLIALAALKTMLLCDRGDTEVIAPLAASSDKRVRTGAIAALAKLSGRAAADWFERGLKDQECCVRLATAAVLSQIDPAENRRVFELALYDPNSQVARLAKKLTAGMGYAKAPARG